mgnify:CR=1 FL=1
MQTCPFTQPSSGEAYAGSTFGEKPGDEPECCSTDACCAILLLQKNAVVKPAAERHFGQPVARIQHYGIFACRNIAGSSRRSQHATANAIDIAGLTLEDGTQISVLNDWDDEGAKGAFLRDLRDGACDLFRSVLGPDYNAAHADHFHLDMGPYGICR